MKSRSSGRIGERFFTHSSEATTGPAENVATKSMSVAKARQWSGILQLGGSAVGETTPMVSEVSPLWRPHRRGSERRMNANQV